MINVKCNKLETKLPKIVIPNPIIISGISIHPRRNNWTTEKEILSFSRNYNKKIIKSFNNTFRTRLNSGHAHVFFLVHLRKERVLISLFDQMTLI